ncbi:hypothetical protein GLF_2168 [Gluconobacter frateurii NBRC 101659]|uniref:hypothetical protein n=1 Tax=Gluconobacter japonicus TaxID=376620 RepID=UPI0006A20896|nr:hypothetical protein [Gluconobacter japonicus]GAP25286.1 hypothetical protein GLF_2168 [Gluconobacter frateurii NBRC 101659]
MPPHIFKRTFYSLTFLALAGCVHTTAAVVNVPQASQAPRRVVVPAASNYYSLTDRIVKKNSDVIIASWKSVNVDCTTNPYQVLQIKKQPLHGVAYLADYSVFPQFVEKNPRSRCNKTKVMAKALHYRASTDYTGFDLVLVDAGGPTGEVRNMAFRIKIIE